MESQISDPAAIERALWIASAVAAIAAVPLTLVVARAHRVIVARTAMRLLAAVIAVLLSFGAYFLAATIFFALTNVQLNRQVQTAAGDVDFTLPIVFVHPGALHKLAPLVAIVVTWLTVAVSRRRSRATSD